MRPDQLCVLIPSLEPDERLPRYVDSLLQAGFGLVLVVNDGSGPEYGPVFDSISARERCHVLGYPVNRGKGYALRTGIEYLRDHTDLAGVITADSDGQHTAPDTLKLAEELHAEEKKLLIGSRDFSRKNKNIPFRSRFGNRMTSAVFAALYGHWLPDTQTGLRAVTRDCFDDLLAVAGDRFEYEMNMLIYFAVNRIPFHVIPIQTIYLEENKSSHFHPLRDSWRIYKLLLGSFFRFMGSSLLCFLVDQLLFNLFDRLLMPLLGLAGGTATSVSNYSARVFSSVLNYTINRNLVFKAEGSKGSFRRYIVTCIVIVVLSTLGIKVLSALGMAKWLAKLICDTLLYFASYRIQRAWVFKENQ
ncbi:MAG: bifunctional glycosyltransferase family 2/GtrA family protein [Clostridia bacterium]|nr:bifunctional glycosyltransferase family 2/GtrA family protein [Clostridia bacterium]